MQVAQLPASHEKGGRRPPRAGRLQQCVARLIPNGVLLPFEPDHQRLGHDGVHVRDDNHTLRMLLVSFSVLGGCG